MSFRQTKAGGEPRMAEPLSGPKKSQALPLPEEDEDLFDVDLRRAALNLFVIWQVLCVVFWLAPPSELKNSFVNGAYKAYMFFTGSWQNWDMFAPLPASVDVYLTADIVYRDGSVKTWAFPRMHDLGAIQKYQQERFRKMIENADYKPFMWPYLARFAALSNNNEPQANPVVHVELNRYVANIAPPGSRQGPYKASTLYRTDYATGSLAQ